MNETMYDDNVPGTFYVNTECIACDTCKELAPAHFKLTPDYDHAFVFKQPAQTHDWKVCEEALNMCPVAAIGKKDDVDNE